MQTLDSLGTRPPKDVRERQILFVVKLQCLTYQRGFKSVEYH